MKALKSILSVEVISIIVLSILTISNSRYFLNDKSTILISAATLVLKNRGFRVEVVSLGLGRNTTSNIILLNSHNTDQEQQQSHLFYIVDHTRTEVNEKTSLPVGIQNNPTNTKPDNRINIAFVKPIFTAAAYNNAFYIFYNKYRNVPNNVNITSDLYLLTSNVNSSRIGTIKSVFAMFQLLNNLKQISHDSRITILTDVDVDNGSIFMKNGDNAYNIIILGHQEYVTQQEYDNLRKFVTNGGTMVLLDSNVFYAEVRYDRNNQNITLVKGHEWAFNGKSAWRSVAERWKEETSEWVGSNYLCYLCKITFANDPFEYRHHEEQFITNPDDKILLNYNASMSEYKLPSTVKKPTIAAYELHYHSGKVIALGIYSDDIISNGTFNRYFDSLLLPSDKEHGSRLKVL